MQEIPDVLRAAPFTVRQAARLGVSSRVLAGRRFRQVIRGVYAHKDLDDSPNLTAAAALLVAPRPSLISGVAGLHVHGIVVGDPIPVHVLTTHRHQVRRSELQVIRVRSLPDARYVCPPLACFATACRDLNLLEAVQAADLMLRQGTTHVRALVGYAETLHGRGAQLARRAAGLARPGVDSVRETMLRLCLILAGLPEPDVNPTIGTVGEPIGRMDLVYRRFKIIIEYDGDHHRTDRGQWNADIARQEAAAGGGWLTIRVTSRRMREPRALVTTIHRRLVERGYDGPPAEFTAEWRGLFAGE